MDAWAPVLGGGDPQAPHQALLGTSTLPLLPGGEGRTQTLSRGRGNHNRYTAAPREWGLSSPNRPPKLLTQHGFPLGACCGHLQPRPSAPHTGEWYGTQLQGTPGDTDSRETSGQAYPPRPLCSNFPLTRAAGSLGTTPRQRCCGAGGGEALRQAVSCQTCWRARSSQLPAPLQRQHHPRASARVRQPRGRSWDQRCGRPAQDFPQLHFH